MSPPRLLLVGAFPYPLAQGSQVYLQEQARALEGAGAEVELLVYGRGDPTAPNRARATRGLRIQRTPTWSAPRSLRSGPSLAKPLADLALAATLHDAVGPARHGSRYDAILTHHAEACAIALATRRRRWPPVVYCVHTLLGRELSSYLPGSWPASWMGRWPRTGIDRLGGAIDRSLARRTDGWIALTHTAGRVMRHGGDAPGCVIPPPLADPGPPPGSDPQDAGPLAGPLHGLERDGYFLYSGNLDPYQELRILAGAARALRRDPPETGIPRLVVASHDRSIERLAGALPGIELRYVDSVAGMQALLAGARATLLMRRIEGGFPIKLVNALALGTPAIAFHADEWGLEHERSALVASPDRPALSLAAAIARLAGDDALLGRLRAGARALYLARHRPEDAAARTLALVEALRRPAARGRTRAGSDG